METLERSAKSTDGVVTDKTQRLRVLEDKLENLKSDSQTNIEKINTSLDQMELKIEIPLKEVIESEFQKLKLKSIL